MHNQNHQHPFFERFVYSILQSNAKKFLVIILTLIALVASVMMLPSKLVLAKMLPGKSTNTYSIYIDTPAGSSIEQTKEVAQCVTEILKKEEHVVNMEIF